MLQSVLDSILVVELCCEYPRALLSVGLEQLFEIVYSSYQEPLCSNFVKTSKAELAKAQHVFDMTDGWFDNAFAPGIDTPTLLGQELAFHQFLERETIGNTSTRMRVGIQIVLLSFGSHVGIVSSFVQTSSIVVLLTSVVTMTW